jgi:hypothetical protein
MAEVISGAERKMHLNQKPVKKSYPMDMITLRILSVIAVVFGLLTLKGGGSVIFNIGSLQHIEKSAQEVKPKDKRVEFNADLFQATTDELEDLRMACFLCSLPVKGYSFCLCLYC